MSQHGRTLSEELSDPNHPIRQREWNAFLERRQFLFDDIMAKAGLSIASHGAGFEQDPIQTIDAMAILDGFERMQMANQMQAGKPPDMRERDYQQLIGNAMIYGIANPESLSIGELQQQIEQRRIRRRGGEEDFGGLFESVSLTSGGPVFLGALDALVRTAETLPFIGDKLTERESVQAINQWIGMAREAHQGDMDGRELLGAQVGEGIGNLVGYIAPGIGAWKLAGWALGVARIGGFTGASQVIRGKEIIQTAAKTWGLRESSPIIFHGIQGGLATWMLEAGGDAPIQERAINIALGTGLGVAFDIGGPVAVGAAGLIGGGIIGAAADEPLAGAVTGLALSLAGHRAFRAFSRNSGLNNARQSTWFDVHLDPNAPLQIPPGNATRGPRVVPEPPRGLPPGTPERNPASPAFAIGAPESPAGFLPQVSGVTQQVSDFTWRGTRSLFYYGKEAPEDLIQRWSATQERGFSRQGEPFASSIFLDNVGKVQQGATHVHMVEANFDNLFVLTPESAPVFRNLIGPAGDFQGVETALRQQGFDGLAIQGVDDLIEMAGIDQAYEILGVPSQLLADQVVAFGKPLQVRYSKPIVNGDITAEVLDSFGMEAVQKIAGVQSATFGREAAKNLRPFEVGSLRGQLGSPPERLSEMRGLMFERVEGGVQNPLIPSNVTRAVVQNHELTGPRIVLLDENRVAQATIPLSSFDEGLGAVERLGFTAMTGNNPDEAIRLAYTMSNADLFTNNSMTHILGQVDSPMVSDLVAISYAENPGRVSVVQGIGSPWDLRRQIAVVNERYGTDLDFDKNIRIAERPTNVFHALIGPEGSITDKMVKQFKEFGVFSGMEAGSTNGIAVRVNSVWREAKSGRARASISPMFSNIKATVPLETILPGRTSVQQPLTGDVYSKFKKFAIEKFNADADAAGLPRVSEIADPSVLTMIDTYIDEFAKGSGLSLFDTGRFADALEWNLAQDMRRLAGNEGKIFEEMLKDQAASITQATESGNYLIPDIEELALAKGFIWEPAWGGRHAQLVDQLSNTIVPFQTRESAEAFLRGFQRTLPDYTNKEMSPMSAFSTFDSHAIKAPATGVEFPSEAVELKYTEQAMRRAAQIADQEVKNAQAFAAADNIIRAGTGGRGSGGSGSGGNPPPPPPSSPSPAPAPQPSGGGPLARFAEPVEDDGTLQALIHRMNMDVARPLPELVVDQVEGLITQLKSLPPNQIENMRKLMHQPHIWYTAPTRTATAIFDDKLREMGVPRPTMWRDFSAVLDGRTKAVNDAAPWIDEVWAYLNVFKRGDRRLGQLYEVMTANSTPNLTATGDPILLPSGHATERDFLMDKYGFTETQKLAVEELRGVLNRLHGEAASFAPDIGFIMDYLPRLRYFLELHGDDGWRTWKNSLPKELQWFALYARDGNLQAYHKDVGRVLETYIRGLFFEKHVRVPYEHVQSQWARPDLPEPIRDYAANWLFVVRHGHPPNHDAVINGLTQTLNLISDKANRFLGTPRIHVTEGEVLNGIGQVMTWQYRNALGNRISTNLREIFQPMLQAPEIGLTDAVAGYSHFLSSPEVRREWTERAMKYGWAEPTRTGVVNSEFATGEIKSPIGRQVLNPVTGEWETTYDVLDPDVIAARELWASNWDKIYDKLPNKLKNGVEGIPGVDANWFYRKSTNAGRIIAGNTGYLHAQKAILRYANGEISFAELLAESGAGNKRWSIKQEFIDKMVVGDFEGAAVVMGNEGAASQFHFGIAEQSEGIRRSGIMGRVGFQFANFANQFAWRLGTNLKHMPWIPKLKYIAMLGTLAAIPEIIGNQTGWEGMKKFNWFRSLTTGGGIAMQPLLNLIQTSTARRRLAAGEELSPEQRFAMQREGDIWGDFLEISNPLGQMGTIQTLSGFSQAASLSTPEDIAEATFKMIIMGDPTSARGERGVESFIDQLIESQRVRPEPRFDSTQGGPASPITEAEWRRFNEMIDSIAGSGPNGGGAF